MNNRQLIYRLISLYLIAQLFHCCSAQSTKYYLDEYPGRDRKTINLRYNSFDSSIVLKASSTKHPKEGHYSFTVLVPNELFESYRIYGTTQSFDLRDSDQLLVIRTTGITNDTIYNSRSTSKDLKSFNTDTFYDKALIFELKLAGSKKFKGFEITLTAARSCFVSRHSNEYSCSNGYCIRESLKCNGRKNCGDDSDESKMTCNKGKLIGFVIGGILLFIAAIAGCVAYCRRYNSNSSPTVITTSTMVYPQQPGNIYPAAQVQPQGGYVYTNQANYPAPNPYYNQPPVYQAGYDKQPLYPEQGPPPPRY